MLRPWERLEQESLMQYKRFCHYLNCADPVSGARSMARLAEALGVTEKALYIAHNKYHWQERAHQYDLYRAGEAALEGHGEASVTLPQAARKLQRAVDRLIKNADEMTAGDISKLVDVILKLQKITEGEAEAREGNKAKAEGQLQMDLSALSSEELVSFDELLAKARIH